MRLVDDWRRVLKRAWSIRLMALAFVLTGAEAAIPLFTDSPPIPRGWFSVVIIIVVGGGFVARLLAQEGAGYGE